jgi:PAS domain S-box-containing protein
MSVISDLCEQLERLRGAGYVGSVSSDAAGEDEQRLARELNLLLDAARLERAQLALRQDVEEKLRAQGVVLGSITDTIPYNVFWKDRDCRYLGCNKAFADLAGLNSPAEIVGLRDDDLPWAAVAEPIQTVDRRVMDSGVAELRVEQPFTGPDGTIFWGKICKVPLRDRAGQVCGLVGVHTDISARKALEAELRAAKEACESAMRVKSEFFANVSHELRTPLTLISGPVEALLERASELPAWAAPQLAAVRRNASRLAILVDDLLDLTKLEAKKAEVSWNAVDVSAVTRELVSDAQATARERGISLETELVELGNVALDRGMYEKILLNLLGNALKFTPAGGRVLVKLLPQDDELELSVGDNGIGIADDKLPLLFTRFQQLDSSSTRRYSGTGLGLALVREISEAMGGRVEVSSKLGKGTCFRVRLPARSVLSFTPSLTPPAPRKSDRSARLADPSPLASVKRSPHAWSERFARDGRPLCLLAEDHPDMREYVAGVLEPEYQVVAVEDGVEALRVLASLVPDVVLSDVMMPRLDGVELVRKIKADPRLRRAPVLLLTARSDSDSIASSLDSGADDYLSKPFAPAELKARLRAARRAYALELTTDELRVGHAVALAAERLDTATRVTELVSQSLAPHLRPSVKDAGSAEESLGQIARLLDGLPKVVELPDATPPMTVDLYELVADTVHHHDGGLRGHTIGRPAAGPLLVPVSVEDMRQALKHILRVAHTHTSRACDPLSIWVGRDQGVPTIVIRDGGTPFSAAERSSLVLGRGSLDLDLLVAHTLLCRSGATLRVEDDPPGSALRIEIVAAP